MQMMSPPAAGLAQNVPKWRWDESLLRRLAKSCSVPWVSCMQNTSYFSARRKKVANLVVTLR
eukprot:319608-Heterocapsa_arctica.AAC.1